MCRCVCVCARECIHSCVNLCFWRPEVTVTVSPSCSPLYFHEQDLTEPGLTGWLVSSVATHPTSVREASHVPSLHVGAREPSSSCYACVPSIISPNAQEAIWCWGLSATRVSFMDQCEKQLLLSLGSLSTWIKDDSGGCRLPV